MAIRHYQFKLTTVGPVFIGNGNEIKKFEYVYDQKTRRVYVIDSYKLFELLGPEQLERFEGHITENKNLTEFFEAVGILQQQYKDIAKYSYEAVSPENENIKEFIKDAYWRPYIPGSSLKGAVRTALLCGLIRDSDSDDEDDVVSKAWDDIRREVEGRYRDEINIRTIERTASKLEQQLIDTLNIKTRNSSAKSIMRGFLISDSRPLSVNDLCLCPKIDVAKKKEDNNTIDLLRECIAPGTQIVFDVDIDDKLFPYDIDYLKDAFDDYYDQQERQMSKFDQFTTFEPEKGKHYIVLGGGAGYVSKTFTYLLMTGEDDLDLKTVSKIMTAKYPAKHHHKKDLDNGVSPHMRKMTVCNGKYRDFGICQIEILSR